MLLYIIVSIIVIQRKEEKSEANRPIRLVKLNSFKVDEETLQEKTAFCYPNSLAHKGGYGVKIFFQSPLNPVVLKLANLARC